MNNPLIRATHLDQYELRFIDLYNRGHGFVFPCDADGRVSMSNLSVRGLANYMAAQAGVGSQLSRPFITRIA